VGEGIFFAGLKHVAIKIIASYTEEQIITTKPSEVLAAKKAKEDLATKTMTDSQDRNDRLKSALGSIN
ncbi:MAG: hypothetical protein WCO16_03515, partial [bacterium]